MTEQPSSDVGDAEKLGRPGIGSAALVKPQNPKQALRTHRGVE